MSLRALVLALAAVVSLAACADEELPVKSPHPTVTIDEPFTPVPSQQ